jgi:hypothetical protein
MQKFSFQKMENSRIKIAAVALLRMQKTQITGTSYPGTPAPPLPRVRTLPPGIPLKPGVRMTLTRSS